MAPIATTPFRSDDIINHTVHEHIKGTGWAAVQSALTYLHDWIVPWIGANGRFFPGSSVWTLTLFSALQTLWQYKLFLAALSLLMIALAARLATTLTGPVGAIVVAAAACTVTLRSWIDGLDTFSGIVPLTVCLTLGCLILLIRRTGVRSAVTAGLCWACALLTYEVAITLTPVLLLVVWLETRRPRRLLPILIPTVCMALIATVLRVRAAHPSPAYTISLEPSRVMRTYLRQVAAALPLSQQWYPNAQELMVPGGLLVLALTLVGIPTMLVLGAASRLQPRIRPKGVGLLALTGAVCWLFPPLLVAVTERWQTELPPGQGYVSVVWGYVGVALLLAAGWATIAHHVTRTHSTWWRAARSVATIALAFLASANLAQSLAIAQLVASHPL